MLKKYKDKTTLDLSFHFLSLELNIGFNCKISIGIHTELEKAETNTVDFEPNPKNPLCTLNQKLTISFNYDPSSLTNIVTL